MLDPGELYELTEDAADVPTGLALVAVVTGFVDAGNAVAQLNSYFVDGLDRRTVAVFDNDVLLDYRARRPTVYFDQDHLSDYQPHRLALHLVTDSAGQQFLLLAGYEPDFQWERFVRAVELLIDRFEVDSFTWVHAIPMPVPHTRPIGSTVSGNRAELVESHSVWRPHTQVLANVLHLLEFRLTETDRKVAGFVLLVPHYLGETELPDAALAGLESISSATGLVFATDQLKSDSEAFLEKINEQVTRNEELARLVGTLEERYDSYMEGRSLRSPLTGEDGELPTADEIAAELEMFLALRHPGDEEPGPLP